MANCGRDSGGRVVVDVTIHGPTGRVSAARVTDGIDQASSACVVRAVSNARFPRFAAPSFSVRNFPSPCGDSAHVLVLVLALV